MLILIVNNSQALIQFVEKVNIPTLKNACFFLPKVEGRDGVLPIRVFENQDPDSLMHFGSFWACLSSLEPMPAMALAGRPVGILLNQLAQKYTNNKFIFWFKLCRTFEAQK